MNEPIVFFDIDGTLLNEQKVLPTSTKEAVFKLHEKGVQVVIATGRAPFMFEAVRKELQIESYIGFNGQYAVFNQEVIYKQALDLKKIKQLEGIASSNEHPMVFLDHTMMKANIEHHPYILESIGSLKIDHPEYDPGFYHDKEIFQALLFCDEMNEGDYKSQFNDLNFIRWHEKSLDVLPFGGSKAVGIKYMLEKAGFLKENVIAFGDGLNDIEMLSYAGTGIAMGNAKDEVKKSADFVTDSVDDDGIIKGLKKLGLL